MANQPTLIIAEAGVNHNGDLSTAKRLIDVAYEAKADIVKFQTFKSELLATANSPLADYQKANFPMAASQLDLLKKLELSESEFRELQQYCAFKGIKFFSTGFDLESLQFLKTLRMGLCKIPSGEITNFPYLEFIGNCGEPVILSTGMSTMIEIEAALNVLTNSGVNRDQITVLHCNTEYPTPFNDVNLLAMKTIERELRVKVGYSDHTVGTEVSVAAVALGARVIEKHFTLDKSMIGPDHSASLDPSELKILVQQIRNVERALGSEVKLPTAGELKNRSVVRKSIVAARDINQGEHFNLENVTIKRPGLGISPMKWPEIIGKKATKNFKKDEPIKVDE